MFIQNFVIKLPFLVYIGNMKHYNIKSLFLLYLSACLSIFPLKCKNSSGDLTDLQIVIIILLRYDNNRSLCVLLYIMVCGPEPKQSSWVRLYNGHSYPISFSKTSFVQKGKYFLP